MIAQTHPIIISIKIHMHTLKARCKSKLKTKLRRGKRRRNQGTIHKLPQRHTFCKPNAQFGPDELFVPPPPPPPEFPPAALEFAADPA